MSAAAHGIGLRVPHYADILERGLPCGIVEGITENFMDRGGRPRKVLEKVRADGVRVALHGVSLSVGGLAPIDLGYVDRVRALADEIDAAWVSDHLCFGDAGRGRGHDLWPLPYDRATLDWVADRVAQVQDRLGRRLLLENVSSYATWRHDEVPEWEAIRYVAERADCLILLDINNVVVNAHNHGFDPVTFLDGIPAERVAQHHLSGHLDLGTHRFDDHAHEVPDEVWALFRVARERFGQVPTIVEWDGDVPELPRVLEESAKAIAIDAELHPDDPVSIDFRPEPAPAAGEAPPRTAADLAAWWEAMRQDLPLDALSDRLAPHRHLRPRLHTYVSGFYARQAKALSSSFPRTTELLGDRFQETVRAYLLAHPSDDPALENLGRHFADFLEDPVIAGVAALERAGAEALLAPDPDRTPPPPVTPETFALAVPVVVPSLRLVRVDAAILDAWGRTEHDAEVAGVVFWRPQTVVRHDLLRADEVRALELARQGASFAAICDVFAGSPEPLARAQQVLGGWSRHGQVSGLRPPTPAHEETGCSPGC
ncbi:MAG: DUF692 family protein [Alphaproteobacteria bacterium]|nr:DUF692 family protein [Alphaproteobacteria bacterium]MCB9699314.1 DUF692 family protein [Alphaproteobacteria bacterium]